jgi:hypothetical protein
MTARAMPFEAMAADYDRSFTESAIAGACALRCGAGSTRRLQPATACSNSTAVTGEDAVHLGQRGVRVLATDSAPGMLAVARQKVDRCGVADLCPELLRWRSRICRAFVRRFSRRAVEFSAGLNCVDDLPRRARARDAAAARARARCCA